MRKSIILGTGMAACIALSACAEATDEEAAAEDGVETVTEVEPMDSDPMVSTGDNSAELSADGEGSSIRVDSDGISADVNEGDVSADINADGEDSVEVEF